MFRVEIFVIVAILSLASSQVIDVGECQDVEIVKDFDASRYVGKWYEAERYPLVFEFLGKCVIAEYSAIDEDTIGVYNEQINSILETKQSINGTATFDGSHSEAKLTVIFDGFLGSKMRGSYWVLGTDYDSYSVVWSCTKLANIKFMSAWILTREAKPSADVLSKAYEVADKNNIDRSHFSKTDQVNCPE